MNFRTLIDIPRSKWEITHNDKLLMLGSCFTENIGAFLSDAWFDTDINPFGTLYNPSSIHAAIARLLEGRTFVPDELFCSHGLWCSFSHHSRFSSSDPDTALTRMNSRFKEAARRLREASTLIVTWGTAYVFSLVATGKVVANCHKLPASEFIRSRLSVSEIVNSWTGLLTQLHAANPDLHVIFTVSPVRHLADGTHGNQLSKSILLLACDRLCTDFADWCSYFPAYEIVLDELRDYRFFANDMTHPSDMASRYVYERFSETFFSVPTRQATADCEQLTRRLSHRPLTDNADAAARFAASTAEYARLLANRYPYMARRIAQRRPDISNIRDM